MTEREQTFIEIFYKSLIETQSIYSDIFKVLLELLRDGYNLEGYDQQGFNRNGIDKVGFDRDGFNCKGFNRQGFRRDGYNIEGYDRQGFNIDGYDKNGFNSIGVNRNGYISPAKWHEIIVAITHPPSYQNKWSAEESYSELNEQDLALASEWANTEKDDDFTMAKMLSARTAEKIAVKFYQSLGYEIIDVSIKQPVKGANNPTTSCSNDWKLFDLLLNGEIGIDVKNARTPLNSKVTYVSIVYQDSRKIETTWM